MKECGMVVGSKRILMKDVVVVVVEVSAASLVVGMVELLDGMEMGGASLEEEVAAPAVAPSLMGEDVWVAGRLIVPALGKHQKRILCPSARSL